ncbi:hypothetical protein DFH07DRAFT_1059148 [Mycena maculata]|uniref:Uncharacterized protein n=1 Tax=Mycena maculata TaxID=230809 RepID=A0AAD7JGQ5_9AGAR|nr:hypothetical protein DFH07DRAFT_1059148 [Mycena maculata]
MAKRLSYVEVTFKQFEDHDSEETRHLLDQEFIHDRVGGLGSEDLISKVIHGLANINRQTKVQSVEYLNDVPSGFPVPWIATAYILDLRDYKFNLREDDDSEGELLSVDSIILDRDQDSWTTSGGGGDTLPKCRLFNG